MKKVKLLVLLLALFMVLAGCGNKVAKVSDANELLFQVGKIKFTKGDLYETLKTDDTGYSVINEAGRVIADKEIETTADIELEAKNTLAEYKKQFGDDFESTIKSYGYADENDLYESIISSIKANKLTEKYIADNKEDIYTKYSPVLAKLLYVEIGKGTAEEAKAKADAAYNMIIAGESFDDAAEKYATNVKSATEAIYTREDNIDLNVAEYLKSVSAPGVSSVFIDKNSKGYYIVQVTATNRSAVEEKFMDYLKADSDFTAEVDHYFFQKHNFQVYDLDVYNYISSLFPNYLPKK